MNPSASSAPRRPRRRAFPRRVFWPPPRRVGRLDGNYRSPAGILLTRRSDRNWTGSGMWTGFPSPTLFSLSLGADLPRADCPCPGNLRLSADGDLTRLSVTHACILSSIPSSTAYAAPSSVHGMLPYPLHMQCRGFGCVLSPVELSAHDYSTSELLRTL